MEQGAGPAGTAELSARESNLDSDNEAPMWEEEKLDAGATHLPSLYSPRHVTAVQADLVPNQGGKNNSFKLGKTIAQWRTTTWLWGLIV